MAFERAELLRLPPMERPQTPPEWSPKHLPLRLHLCWAYMFDRSYSLEAGANLLFEWRELGGPPVAAALPSD